MGRLYLILMIAMGLFGAMASGLRGPTRPQASDGGHEIRLHQGDRDSSPSEPVSSQSSLVGETVLRRHDDGHFYADVTINGTTVTMLVDTGASAVALSADDARRSGIATTIGMSNVIGEGAGGEVHGDFVTIDRIALGSAEQQAVPAVVLNGGSTSLLGQSFLRQFSSVEIRGDEMHLR